jgi:hypothetical protein
MNRDRYYSLLAFIVAWTAENMLVGFVGILAWVYYFSKSEGFQIRELFGFKKRV